MLKLNLKNVCRQNFGIKNMEKQRFDVVFIKTLSVDVETGLNIKTKSNNSVCTAKQNMV